MVPAGIMLDKFGPRIVLTISGILMGLGMIIAGIFLNLIGLIIGFGIIAGAAMGFGYAAPTPTATRWFKPRSEEHTSELQSRGHLVCRLLLEKKNKRQ